MSKHYTIQTKKTIELFCCNILLEQHIKALREGKRTTQLALRVKRIQ
jgi:hypothetical protein